MSKSPRKITAVQKQRRDPRITVCVATKNRTDMLHQLLWSLIRQEYPHWDLIIVDDSDAPVNWGALGVYPQLLSHLEFLGHQWKVVPGPRAGKIGLAYQHGFWNRYPESELFFRVDDDSWLEPNYFTQMVNVMRPGVAAVAGLFLHPGGPIEELSPADPRLKHTQLEHLSDQINMQWFKHRSSNLIETELLMGNILFDTDRLTRVGGFDERYNQHRDETQVGYRLLVDGGKLYIHPRAVAWHLRGVNGGARGAHPNVYLNDHRFFMQQVRTMKAGLRIDLGNALGDGIMYTPMLEGMRSQNPGRNISVWAMWGETVLKNNPHVDEVCKTPEEGHRTQYITGGVYEWATQNAWQGHYIEAACKMMAVPMPEDAKPRLYLTDEDKPPHLPIGQYVAIAPWSMARTFDLYGPAGNKNWLLGRWTELVSWLEREGYYTVQLRGSDEETEIPGIGECWTGRTMREVFHLIKNAALVISVDTFAHHAAVALDVPAVVLWGRSKPEQFGYDLPTVRNVRGECPGMLMDQQIMVNNKPQTVKVMQERPCIGANQWAMDQIKCPMEKHPCMEEITVERVWEAVKELLPPHSEEGLIPQKPDDFCDDCGNAHFDCDTGCEMLSAHGG